VNKGIKRFLQASGLVDTRPLARLRHKGEDNIKMDLKETGWEDMDWIHLPWDKDQWRTIVNAVMNLRVP
jgi:hypothetical protein